MRFITDPGLLKLICSRCESYDCSVQSKSRYFAFVSYAASSNEITVKNQSQNYPNNEIFRRLKKHYETRWFQRKLREPIRTRSEPHGKETNVTVALAVSRTLISKHVPLFLTGNKKKRWLDRGYYQIKAFIFRSKLRTALLKRRRTVKRLALWSYQAIVITSRSSNTF